MKFAYADPPYPGQAHYYRDHPDYAGEVDHADLIAQLEAGWPDGWALSTRAGALQTVLAICPGDVRVAVWHNTSSKPPVQTNWWWSWEPVIIKGGRRGDGAPVVRDVLVAPMPHNPRGGRLIGQKPDSFSRWVFGLLGARPGDHLDDMFPGSGSVARAWTVYASQEWLQPVDRSRKPRTGERHKAMRAAGMPELFSEVM